MNKKLKPQEVTGITHPMKPMQTDPQICSLINYCSVICHVFIEHLVYNRLQSLCRQYFSESRYMSLPSLSLWPIEHRADDLLCEELEVVRGY